MSRAARYSLLGAVLLIVPILPWLIVGELPGDQWLSTTDDNALLFGLTGAAVLASDVLLPVPSSIVGTLLGSRLGFWPGWAWGWVGLSAGSAVGYGLGRAALARLAEGLPQTPTLLVLVMTRPVPLLAEAVTFAAGAGRMRLVPFLLASGISNAVYTGALAANGAALLPTGAVGLGLVLPLSLPAVAWLVWKWRVRRRG